MHITTRREHYVATQTGLSEPIYQGNDPNELIAALQRQSDNNGSNGHYQVEKSYQVGENIIFETAIVSLSYGKNMLIAEGSIETRQEKIPDKLETLVLESVPSLP